MLTLKKTPVFSRWVDKLKDSVGAALIAARLARLETGYMGETEPVGKGVYELKIHYGPGYRIYFKKHGKEIIVLLCGGDKSSQSRDIKQAKELALQWSKENE